MFFAIPERYSIYLDGRALKDGSERVNCTLAAAPELPVFILEVFTLWLKCG